MTNKIVIDTLILNNLMIMMMISLMIMDTTVINNYITMNILMMLFNKIREVLTLGRCGPWSTTQMIRMLMTLRKWPGRSPLPLTNLLL